MPHLKAKAICKFSTCKACYTFTMLKKPNPLSGTIIINVRCSGSISHLKTETRFRPASNIRRGRIARLLPHRVSQAYYKRLSTTPVQELISGNITQSLSKNILKVIAAEVRKSMQMHENMLLELPLTRRILRQCDNNFCSLPGYIRHLQVNPFGVHLYTEIGISILVHHLHKKAPVSLYLDAVLGVTHYK